MSDEFRMTEEDLPPIWSEKVSSLEAVASVILILLAFILLAVSPALVIAVWRWAL